jgi:hypothetical protein
LIQTVPAGHPGMIEQSCYVMVPHWAIVFTTAIPPFAWLRRRRMLDSRARSGLCLTCGYDLRGTSDPCPECGAEAKPQPAEGAAA